MYYDERRKREQKQQFVPGEPPPPPWMGASGMGGSTITPPGPGPTPPPADYPTGPTAPISGGDVGTNPQSFPNVPPTSGASGISGVGWSPSGTGPQAGAVPNLPKPPPRPPTPGTSPFVVTPPPGTTPTVSGPHYPSFSPAVSPGAKPSNFNPGPWGPAQSDQPAGISGTTPGPVRPPRPGLPPGVTAPPPQLKPPPPPNWIQHPPQEIFQDPIPPSYGQGPGANPGLDPNALPPGMSKVPHQWDDPNWQQTRQKGGAGAGFGTVGLGAGVPAMGASPKFSIPRKV